MEGGLNFITAVVVMGVGANVVGKADGQLIRPISGLVVLPRLITVRHES